MLRGGPPRTWWVPPLIALYSSRQGHFGWNRHDSKSPAGPMPHLAGTDRAGHGPFTNRARVSKLACVCCTGRCSTAWVVLLHIGARLLGRGCIFYFRLLLFCVCAAHPGHCAPPLSLRIGRLVQQAAPLPHGRSVASPGPGSEAVFRPCHAFFGSRAIRLQEEVIAS